MGIPVEALDQATSSNNVAFCEDKKAGGFDVNAILGNLKQPEWVSMETMKPLAGGLSFGGMSGFIAGYALKQIGKVVAVAVGTLYVIFQIAASYEYIKVNWKKIEADVMNALDTNNDGKVDEKDA